MQDVPELLQEIKENLVDKNFQPHQYSPSSSHELAMEPRAKVVSGKNRIYTHFPKDRNCGLRTKITRASCRRCTCTVVPRMFFVKDVYHEIIIHILLWYKIWQLSGYNPTRAKQTSKETQKNLMKFLEPTRKPKVIYNDNSLEFGKSCEDLSWKHSRSTSHRSKKRAGLLREQCVESRKV